MQPEIINVLIQLPIVGVFVWYSWQMNKQFQEFLREERTAREKQSDALVREIGALRSSFDAHAEETSRALAVMRDRTTRAAGRGGEKEW